MWQFKSVVEMPASCVRVSGSSPKGSTSDLASCYCTWKAADDGPNTWAPAITTADLDRAPGSWSLPWPSPECLGSEPANRFFSLSPLPSVSVGLPNKGHVLH